MFEPPGSAHLVSLGRTTAPQHGSVDCIGGQTTVPNEQKTQQCPANGRSNAWHPVHS